MITSLEQLVKIAKSLKKKYTIAIPSANESSVIRAVGTTVERGIVSAILIGNELQIKKEAERAKIDISKFEILPEPDVHSSITKAIKIVKSGKADIIMKGKMNTDVLLHEILNKKEGLRKKNILSHIALFEIAGFDRLIILTDAGVNVAPDISRKAEIIRNAIDVAHIIGITVPKVALLAAVEKVIFPAMPATRDASILSQMGKTGGFGKAIVDGPLGLDNAISIEAAQIKGIKSEVAGCADILVAPDIESANILYKSLVHFAKAKVSSIIFGAAVPLIVTSRADGTESKLFSIALGILLSHAASKAEIENYV